MLVRRPAPGLFAFLILALGYLALSCNSGKERELKEVDVETRFPTKIVYGTEAAVDTAALEAHCTALGGVFNECGSVCAPEAPICAEVCAFTCEGLSPEGVHPAVPDSGSASEEVDTSAWEGEVTSRAYGFRVPYPTTSWSFHRDTSFSMSPKFNLYQKPPGVPLDLPLDHFSNVSHFSVYPKGIPTEGLFGDVVEFNLRTSFPVSEESKVFVLDDGTTFAAYVKPADPPEGWGEAGFVWLRVRVEDLEVRCLREGEEVGAEECDPLAREDRILRSGTVDPRVWETEITMLQELRLGIQVGSASIADTITLRKPEPGDLVGSPLGPRLILTLGSFLGWEVDPSQLHGRPSLSMRLLGRPIPVLRKRPAVVNMESALGLRD
jgi:hypothetical protein